MICERINACCFRPLGLVTCFKQLSLAALGSQQSATPTWSGAVSPWKDRISQPPAAGEAEWVLAKVGDIWNFPKALKWIPHALPSSLSSSSTAHLGWRCDGWCFVGMRGHEDHDYIPEPLWRIKLGGPCGPHYSGSPTVALSRLCMWERNNFQMLSPRVLRESLFHATRTNPDWSEEWVQQPQCSCPGWP